MRALAPAIWMALALTPRAANAESSLSCGGGIVQLGDSALDLLAKCGKPALEERFLPGGGVDETLDGETASSASTESERWTYNFGPSRFTYVVTLRLGTIAGIDRGTYGYSPEKLARSRTTRCDSSAIRPGDNKLDLLAKCGAPAFRSSRVETRGAEGAPAVTPAPGSVIVETWQYDLGPQQFRAIVTLEGGKVVRVERGSWGTGK